MPENSSAPPTCHATGCTSPCDSFILCTPHWKQVPPAVRMAIESSPDPTDLSSPFAQAAIAEIAHREARRKPAAPRPPAAPAAAREATTKRAARSKTQGRSQQGRPNPVQLALFGDDKVLTTPGKRQVKTR